MSWMMSLRMGESSYERFKSWVDNIYWSHFQVLHFAQLLRSGFDQPFFALPKTFSDKLKKKLPDNMGLRGPSGIVWKIELTTRDDTLYFSHGWQQFVEDHYLKENDFLVFKYTGGESLFDVLIFDGENSCEKTTSYFVRKSEQTEHEGGCSSKRKDTDCVVEVNAPSNAGLKHAAPEKTVNDSSDRVPAAVPFESAIKERNFNAGVGSASPVQYMHADGYTVPGGFLLLEHGRGCSSKRKDTDNSVEEGSSPFNTVECAAPEISVHNIGVGTPAAVPSDERTFNAGVESVSPEQFMDAKGDMVPTAVPSQTTNKRVREAVSAVKHLHTKQRERPPKASSACQAVVDNDDCGNGVKIRSNADMECAAPEKYVNNTSVIVPAAVPFEAPSSEMTFNAGVESSTPEKFMDANGDAVPTAVPSQTTDKRVRKAVSAVKHVHTKRRGRPPKASNACQVVVDNDNCVEEVNNDSKADVECAAPGKSMNNNSVIVSAAGPFEAPSSERIFNAGVESSSPKPNGDVVPTAVPSQTTSKRVRKSVFAVKHVRAKQRGRSPKASGARQAMVDNDDCGKDVKTSSNADVECAAPGKSVDNNSIIVPAAVLFEAPSSERTFNADVDSSSLEQFKDVNEDAVPTAVPSQTTGKRVRKAVSAVKHVSTKQRGRPSKASSAHWAMVDDDVCLKDLKTPSIVDVERAPHVKSMNNNSVIVPTAVPFKAPSSESTFDADVDSSSLVQFKDVNGDAVPTVVPSQTTAKRVRKAVSAVKHVPTKQRGRPSKASSARQVLVDNDDCGKDVKTPSNADVECAPEKSVNNNSVIVPATVPFEALCSERTFNAGGDFSSLEQFKDVKRDVVLTAVRSGTTDKRARKLVSAFSHVQTKQKGRPGKVSSSIQGVVDSVNCRDKADTPSKAAMECAVPAESMKDNSVVPSTVHFKTPARESTFDAGVASSEKFMQANGGTVPIVVPLQTADNKFMIRKLVSQVKHVPAKPSESPPKASIARQGAVDWVTDSEAASVRQSEPHVELFTSNRRPVTEDEINNAQRLAQAACSNKSLLIVMRREHVYDRFCLSMPSKWIVEHLPQRSQDLILRMGESKWHVKYCYHRTSYTGELTVGWRNFALDNNLEEFDVCVFEATGRSKINDTLIMEVKIFRVVKDISPLSMAQSSGKRGRKRAINAI